MRIQRKRLWQVLIGAAICIAVLIAIDVGYTVLVCAGVIPVTPVPSYASTEVDGYLVEVELVSTHPMLSEHDIFVTVRKGETILAKRTYCDTGGRASIYLLREGDEVFAVSAYREGIVLNPSTGTIRDLDNSDVPDDWGEAAFGRFAFLHRNGETKYQWVPKEEYPEHWNVKGSSPEPVHLPDEKMTADALTSRAVQNRHSPSRGIYVEIVGVTVAPTDPTYGPTPARLQLAGHLIVGADQPPMVVCVPYWSKRAAFRSIPVGHRVRVVGMVENLQDDGRATLVKCTAIDLGPIPGK